MLPSAGGIAALNLTQWDPLRIVDELNSSQVGLGAWRHGIDGPLKRPTVHTSRPHARCADTSPETSLVVVQGLSALSLVTEVWQALTGTRSGEVTDIVSDAIATILGVVAILTARAAFNLLLRGSTRAVLRSPARQARRSFGSEWPRHGARLSPRTRGRSWLPTDLREVGCRARTAADHTTLMHALLAFQECPIAPDTRLTLAIQNALWSEGLLRAAGGTDTLIAAYAIVNDATVIHYDRDFEHLRTATGTIKHPWIIPTGTA